MTTQALATPIVLPTELVVILNPYNLGFSEFVGSRAMLAAEGLIPDGIHWPEGFDDLYWQAGQFDYRLCRQKPAGTKGPRRDFATCDWWCLRQELINGPSPEAIRIQIREQALKDEIYRQSAQGQAERNDQWNRYWKVSRDEKYQAFKALIPGLVRPKRGRRQQNTEQSKGANHV